MLLVSLSYMILVGGAYEGMLKGSVCLFACYIQIHIYVHYIIVCVCVCVCNKMHRATVFAFTQRCDHLTKR